VLVQAQSSLPVRWLLMAFGVLAIVVGAGQILIRKARS